MFCPRKSSSAALAAIRQCAREDVAIHVSKRAFAHHVPMIVRPTANLWVELIDQVGGRHTMCSFDDSSDAIQEGLRSTYVLLPSSSLGWSDRHVFRGNEVAPPLPSPAQFCVLPVSKINRRVMCSLSAPNNFRLLPR
jgi:hypothetical protein